MEQVNVEQPTSAPVPTNETPAKKTIIIGGILFGFILFGVGGYIFGIRQTSLASRTSGAVPGQPSIIPQPTSASVTLPVQQTGSTQYKFSEMGVTMLVPKSLYVFEGEKSGDNPPFTLFIQNFNDQNPLPQGRVVFQMYFLVQNNPNITPQEMLDFMKSELESSSIKEVIVDGHKVVQGQVKGQRNRFYSGIITSRGLIDIFTSDPTAENEQLANSIISTFKFGD